MFSRLSVLTVFVCALAAAQSTNVPGNRTFQGSVDMASATAQRGRQGGTLPSTCTLQYEQFLLTTTSTIYVNTNVAPPSCTWVAASQGIAGTVTAPLVWNPSTLTLTINQANGSQPGYLSSADWTTFNTKQTAITSSTGQIIGNLAGVVGGLPALTFSGTNNLIVGIGTPISFSVATQDNTFFYNISTGAAATGAKIGSEFQGTANSAVIIRGITGIAASSSTSTGNLTNATGGLEGISGLAQHNGMGVLSKASGVKAQASLPSTVGSTIVDAAAFRALGPLLIGGSTITTYAEISVDDSSAIVIGTLTNHYGLYIPALVGGVNKYAINVVSDTSLFGGPITYTAPGGGTGDVLCFKAGSVIGHAVVTTGAVGSCL